MIIRETQYHCVQDEGDDWPPTQGIALVQWLLRKFDTVPKEYASTIEVILSASDDEQAIISIEYSRPPTHAEENESKKLASEKSDRVRIRELAELERLKEKYEQQGGFAEPKVMGATIEDGV
jgi:hypothetical protein